MIEIKLDKKDKSILYELDIDSRQSFGSIAKRVGLSKQVVDYRIKNLEKKGVIKGYYTVLNTSKLGYLYCRIFLKTQNLSAQKEKELYDYIRKISQVGWFGCQEGYWDNVIVLLVKSVSVLYEVYTSIIERFNEFLLDKEASIAAEVYHLKSKYLHKKKDNSYSVLGGEPDLEYIHKVDLEILKLLGDNARIPIIEISRILNISSKNVLSRIRKLENKRYILEYRTFFDHKAIGYHNYHVFLHLQRYAKNDKNHLIKFLQQHPNTLYITKAISESDLEFDVIVESHNYFHKVMDNIKKKNSNIIRHYQAELIYDVYSIRYMPTY
ncbi:MAG: winged helix-turn-helix transcriptional regulator [archaeon]